jgi:hypothetical protein
MYSWTQAPLTPICEPNASQREKGTKMGFLDHNHQRIAFHYLVCKFLYRGAKHFDKKPSQLSDATIELIAHDFMELYEKKLWPLWPSDVSGPLEDREHLQPDSDLQYSVQGRKYTGDSKEDIKFRAQWHVQYGKEMTHVDQREMSWLYAWVSTYFDKLKFQPEAPTELTEEQLLACVLAGQNYAGEGKTMAIDGWRSG